MGLRKNSDLTLTIALALVDRFIDSEDTYFKRKEEILEKIKEFVSSYQEFKDIKIMVNNLDVRGRGIDGLYLTVLGTCADSADSGQVGRGNRVSGVIPLNRPAGSEAAAGKNPVSHVGKIYSILSFQMAEEIYKKIEGTKEVYVWLLSRIGEPINKPAMVSVQLSYDGDVNKISSEIENIIISKLENIKDLVKDLAEGKIWVC